MPFLVEHRSWRSPSGNGRQTPCLDLPIDLLTSFIEGFQKDDSVFVIVEDRLATVAAVHDMINGSRILLAPTLHNPHLRGRVY
ncbi:MAG TPA: hypothetical protein VL361_26220 [Candidatus Limnocylindrales bacterium]|nr:hypothetical protein [Candidatus Limnocylindrales bacterium]